LNIYSRLYGEIIKHFLEKKILPDRNKRTSRIQDGSIHNWPYILFKATDRERMAVGQPLHLLFVDLEKAYDSVPLKNVWKALEN